MAKTMSVVSSEWKMSEDLPSDLTIDSLLLIGILRTGIRNVDKDINLYVTLKDSSTITVPKNKKITISGNTTTTSNSNSIIVNGKEIFKNGVWKIVE